MTHRNGAGANKSLRLSGGVGTVPPLNLTVPISPQKRPRVNRSCKPDAAYLTVRGLGNDIGFLTKEHTRGKGKLHVSCEVAILRI
ncbi:hypothetical protein VTI28DRAFT_5639 [Corynascus sepedonium]